MLGYLGWRWIFILEGVLTCVVSLIWFFIIPDFPEDTKWLSEEERALVKQRLAEDQGPVALERRITFKDVVNCFKDFKFLLGGLMYFGLIVPGKYNNVQSFKLRHLAQTRLTHLQHTHMPILHLQSSSPTATVPLELSSIPCRLGPLRSVSVCSLRPSPTRSGTASCSP